MTKIGVYFDLIARVGPNVKRMVLRSFVRFGPNRLHLKVVKGMIYVIVHSNVNQINANLELQNKLLKCHNSSSSKNK